MTGVHGDQAYNLRSKRNREAIDVEAALRGGLCEFPSCTVRWEDGTLEWHHRDPTTKTFKIARAGGRYSLERVVAELAKCDLLCSAHHAAQHPRVALAMVCALVDHANALGRYGIKLVLHR